LREEVEEGRENQRSLIALMIELADTSETLANFYQTTRRYIPEDSAFILAIVRT
jgi:hypothetical protein